MSLACALSLLAMKDCRQRSPFWVMPEHINPGSSGCKSSALRGSQIPDMNAVKLG
jgi:hypothetical protein